VADVRDGRVEEVERRTTITRLGQDVDRSGRLAPEAMERVYEAVAGYRKMVDELHAEHVVAAATSAVRDSANGDEFRATLMERYGVDAQTIPGEEEARLTFLGATSARGDDDEPTLVIDIGGGSTEFVVGRPRRDPDFHVSTQAGSVRQTERHIEHDPPSMDELRDMAAALTKIIADAIPRKVREQVTRGIAVAGTATSLAAIDQDLEPYDSGKVEGYVLSREAAGRILERLAAVNLEERQQIKGLHPQRAPTIVAGATILVQALEAFGLDEIEVSEADILHGLALKSSPITGRQLPP
jgi:exopolyphosphatase / guanosine-5'-triphosphate,3'-diphosphate pyrophosphatase